MIGATGKKPQQTPLMIGFDPPVLNTRKQLSNVDRYLETMGNRSIPSGDRRPSRACGKHHAAAKEIMTNAIIGSLNDADRTVLGR